jgi:NADPH2:quinone reductase
MTKAIRIYANGGPDVMRWEDITLPLPGVGEARICHTAIALNFSDVNVRRGGFYMTKPPQFPLILGNEAAGIVATVGAGVRDLRPGDRVAYVGIGGPFYENTGAYAEERNVPAACLIRLPDGIAEAQAAAHGCDHAILYREVDFVAAVRKLVPQGVAAVFDGVGKDTFTASLDCVRPFGMLVNYGNASGHVPPLDLLLLSKKGSLSVSRPGFSHYIADTQTYRAACAELFDLVARGILKVEIGRSYALRDAATAHRDLEDRSFAGSLVLLP